MNFDFSEEQKLLQKTARDLREKELLLVLDGFEHLLDGVGLLSEILDAAPYVKMLAASQQRLNLRAEWLLDIAGLHYPTH